MAGTSKILKHAEHRTFNIRVPLHNTTKQNKAKQNKTNQRTVEAKLIRVTEEEIMDIIISALDQPQQY